MSDEQIPQTDHDMARETDVTESDPNADSPEGLAGGMGVSSEVTGHVRGSQEQVTYGSLETHPDVELDSGRPEQSSRGPVVKPDPPALKRHHPRAHDH